MIPPTQGPPPSFSLVSPLLPVAAEILQANDNLTQVINLYKQLVRGEEVNGDATAASIPGEQVAGELGASGAHQPGTRSRVECWFRVGGRDPDPLRWGAC